MELGKGKGKGKGKGGKKHKLFFSNTSPSNPFTREHTERVYDSERVRNTHTHTHTHTHTLACAQTS